MFTIIRQLAKRKIIGMNSRNLDFVLKYNKRDNILKVNDKLVSKQMAIGHGIQVPQLYQVIEYDAETEKLEEILQAYPDFVIKPDRGTGGQGILIISETIKHKYRKISGPILDIEQLRNHILTILTGVFSLGGYRDKALIEYRVKCDPLFENICYRGVPDIRIVVLRGYPMMAMVRLPTITSDGKANLHQGAIGAGIDIVTGKTLNGVLGNHFITEHPDTLYPISNLQIPHWPKLLDIAAKCYELTSLGYFGVDIVIDEKLGPLLLELNAHPGLNIQIANNDGIGRRAALLEPYIEQSNDAQKRIEIIQQVFA